MANGKVRSRWSVATGTTWLVALICAAPVAPAAIGGFLVTRPVDVDHPGVVKLSLAPDDIREMLPAAGDLLLFSPEGQELPYHRLFESAEERRTPVRLLAVERRAAGWRIRLDAGSDAAPHRALLFEMKQTTLAPGVRLESSSDGESWRLLAESDLFRVGDNSGMRGATLGYEPTTDRFLNLDWPAQAGFPEAERIALERSPASPIERRVTAPECRVPVPGETVCRLRNDSYLARRLALEISGEGRVGYRLAQALDGSWQPVGEGVWHLEAGAAGLRVAHIPRLERPTELRLELYGAAAAPPALTAYSFDYLPQTVFFRAVVAGRYTLAYGGDSRPAAGTLESTAAERRMAALVEAGAALRHPRQPLRGTAVEARGPLPAGAFSRRWQVLAPAAKGGSVVRLPLPAEVLGVSQKSLADLRLAVGDRQLPFLLLRQEAPEAVATGAGQRPRPGDAEGISTLEVKLPDTAVRLTQLELATHEGPFRRNVSVRTGPDPRRKLGSPEPLSAWSPWLCEAREPLPCRLSLALKRVPGHGRLELEIDNGDNPPLGELRIDLWRSAPGLVFVWPERGAVRLLAGNPEPQAPAYDLEIMREQVLRRSWVEAHVDLGTAAELRARTDRRGRLLLVAVLAAAALFLVFLLARVVNSPGRQ